ncbi:MAG: hypothetical protein JJ974_00645 [Phycisphaerales bacterium]|nr:hypothetical protein [Phycisphaerales bacterium]
MEHLNATSTTTTVRIGQAGPLKRLLLFFAVILFAVLSLIIAIPLILLALILGLVFYIILKIKSLFTKAHAPNGPLDGRHNVKVISPDE